MRGILFLNDLFLPATDFLTKCPYMIEEKRIDHTPAEDRKPDRVHETGYTTTFLPPRYKTGIPEAQNSSDLFLIETPDSPVLPQKIRNLFICVIRHRLRIPIGSWEK